MELRRIEIGGQQRQYVLAEPARRAKRLILCLHGTRSNATDQARLSRMATVVDRAAAVVVFPQAVQPIGRGYEWNHETDLPYVSGVIDELCTTYSLDSGQVCLTGMSGGARMACHFASRRPEAIGLVAAVGGLRAPSPPGPAPAKPVRILAFHGTADRINPYQGSDAARWAESVPEAAERWARANGTEAGPRDTVVSRHITRTTYGPEGAANGVVLWTVRGGGHTWPGTRLGPMIRLVLGHTTTEIDATALIVDDLDR